MYLCCLARLRRSPVGVVHHSGYKHRQGASFGGNRADASGLHTTYRRRALSERNKTAVMLVCTPTLLVWPLLALHSALLAIEGALLALLKRDARIWSEIYGHAIGYVFHHFAELRARRRDVQGSRQVRPRMYWRGFTWRPRKLDLLRRHGLPVLH